MMIMSNAKNKTNKLSIDLIFLILLISNIVFFAALIQYYFYIEGKISIPIGTVNNIITMLSALIILGFISTRLPQFRMLGDSSIYEIGYLIVIGLLSLIISYFNKSTHSDTILYPYLEMFKVISVMLIFTLIATKTKPFKEIINGKFTKKNLILCFIIFTILGILASKYHVTVTDSYANVRNLIMMIAGIIGGPIIGIPTAIISGVFRYSLGGPTAFPCAVSTVLSGFLGSLLYILNGRKFLRTIPAVSLMFLYTGLDMLIIVFLTPSNISIPYVSDIYPLMLFANVLGMILFVMILKEQKSGDKKPITYEELKIKEMENMLEEYDEKIEKLEQDIEKLKNKEV